MYRRFGFQTGRYRSVAFTRRAVTLRTILFINHLPPIHAGHLEFMARPGLVIREVLHALQHEEPDHRAELWLRRIRQKLAAVRREVLRILPESEEPILVVPLSCRNKRRALRTSDELAVLFDHVTAETGVRLERHPTKRRVELRHLREIECADFDSRILVVLSKVIGDGVGLRFGDHRMLG